MTLAVAINHVAALPRLMLDGFYTTKDPLLTSLAAAFKTAFEKAERLKRVAAVSWLSR